MTTHVPALIPPFRFSSVQDQLYRGSYPTLKNFRFLRRLQLKTIVSVIPEPPTSDLVEFCQQEKIASHHFYAEKFTSDNVTVSPATVAQIYTAVSKQIRAIVEQYDPDFRALSLDEVYCDITDYMDAHWTRYAASMTAEEDGHEDEDDDDDAKRDLFKNSTMGGNFPQQGTERSYYLHLGDSFGNCAYLLVMKDDATYYCELAPCVTPTIVIVSVIPEPPTSDLVEFCQQEKIASHHFYAEKFTSDNVTVSPATVAQIYTAVSKQIRAIVEQYDPDFRALSLDEVYCDITDYMDAHWTRYAATMTAEEDGHEDEDDDDDDDAKSDEDDASVAPALLRQREAVAAAIVAELRQKIFEETQLTASAGVAANSMLAKICSDMNKPNGQFVLPFSRDRIVAFMRSLPVRKIGGIGKVMEKVLGALGVETAQDLFDRRVEIFHVFTPRTAQWLLQVALGIHASSERSSGDDEASHRKSYSRERTFRGISDPRWLEKICRDLCDMLEQDLSHGAHGGKTVTLKLKCVDFSVKTRAVSTVRTLHTSDDLFDVASELLRKELPLQLRLMGVRVSALVPLGDSQNKRANGDAAQGTRRRQAMIERFARAEQPYDPFEELEQRLSDAASVVGGSRSEDDDAAEGGRHRQLGIQSFATDSMATADPFEDHEMRRSGPKKRKLGGRQPLLAGAAVHEEKTERDSASSFQPCPVCGKMINASNVITIALHVDSCLQQTKGGGGQRGIQGFLTR
ncbi:hypothetical protein ATCC90586_010265 [Pythium insidiosum]|nr:hypothetical protein ATCC90586_010265 [Pythium insidiosum]